MIRLVGILVGVPSSLTRDNVDPCRDAGRDVLGVRLDLIGIEVFVVSELESVLEGVADSVLEGVVDSVLEGVRRPKDAESE